MNNRLSCCRQTPLSLMGWPLTNRPWSGSNLSWRMPNVVMFRRAVGRRASTCCAAGKAPVCGRTRGGAWARDPPAWHYWPGCMSSSFSFNSVLATTVPVRDEARCCHRTDFTVHRMLPSTRSWTKRSSSSAEKKCAVNDVAGSDDGLLVVILGVVMLTPPSKRKCVKPVVMSRTCR